MPKAAPVSACTEPGAASFWVFGNVKAKEQTGEAPNYNKDSIKVLDLSNCTGLTSIGSYAFAGSGLTSIDLSNTEVTIIPHGTFLLCDQLAEVKLPKGLKTIAGTYEHDNGAFEQCDGLTEITFYNVPEMIEPNAFFGVIADSDPPNKLTIHCPSSIREDLERILATDKGFTAEDFSSERVVFKEDPTLATLTYLFDF